MKNQLVVSFSSHFVGHMNGAGWTEVIGYLGLKFVYRISVFQTSFNSRALFQTNSCMKPNTRTGFRRGYRGSPAGFPSLPPLPQTGLLESHCPKSQALRLGERMEKPAPENMCIL